MNIVFASDHRGYQAKGRLIHFVKGLGHQVHDVGCHSDESCDYPDAALAAALIVAERRADLAILFDGTGIGVTICANKVPGVRAAAAADELLARRCREHNHCNALCLGADLLSEEQMRLIVIAFLSAECGAGRHARRVQKITDIEHHAAPGAGSGPNVPSRPSPPRHDQAAQGLVTDA